MTSSKKLFDKCDSILLGGGMIFTFYKAMGLEIGNSICEEDKIELAEELIKSAKERNINLILPIDVVVAESFSNDSPFTTVDYHAIQKGQIGMDIGTKTVNQYREIINSASTIFWNGPMGVFEMSNFAKGTFEVAKALAELTSRGGITVIGGGRLSRCCQICGIR